MKRLLRNATGVLLAFLMVLSPVFSCLPSRVNASVQDNIRLLSEWQKDFLEVIKSLALHDSYLRKNEKEGTGVFASITAAQALYEGGWARYRISVIANNQFGIKAYANWDGKVFDNDTKTLYSSYEELVHLKGATYARRGSIWRAYDTWDESVYDHSQLFYDEKKYDKVLHAKTYQEAAREIVKAGYNPEDTYAPTVIKVIEDYGLDQLDNVKPTTYGIVGLVMDHSKAVVPIGEEFNLSAEAYPEPVVPEGKESPKWVWESNAPNVATVDKNGHIKAVSPGIALITAKFEDRVAACLVSVGTNAFTIDGELRLYEKADSNSKELGKISRGMPVMVMTEDLYKGPDGKQYYHVRGTTTTGKLVFGYADENLIYVTGRSVSVLNTKKKLQLEKGTDYPIVVEVIPSDAADKTLTWKSSDPSIATITQNGELYCKEYGEATITVTAVNGISVSVKVMVGREAVYEAVAMSNLYLRSTPDKDADNILGTIVEGTHIKLVGEPRNGWYEVRANILGVEDLMEGYCNGTYAQIIDDDFEPLPEPDPLELERTGVVSVDSGSLNLRVLPGLDKTKLFSVPKGTAVTVLGEDLELENEKQYKIWYRMRVSVDGRDYEAYAAADFIRLTGPIGVLNPSEYYDITDEYVFDVRQKTSLSEFLRNLGTMVHVYHLDETRLQTNDFVRSGDELRLVVGDTVMRQLTIIVRGDVNGDGEVNALDYLMAKRALLCEINLPEYSELAAKISGGDELSHKDYLMLKRVVLGLEVV